MSCRPWDCRILGTKDTQLPDTRCNRKTSHQPDLHMRAKLPADATHVETGKLPRRSFHVAIGSCRSIPEWLLRVILYCSRITGEMMLQNTASLLSDGHGPSGLERTFLPAPGLQAVLFPECVNCVTRQRVVARSMEPSQLFRSFLSPRLLLLLLLSSSSSSRTGHHRHNSQP